MKKALYVCAHFPDERAPEAGHKTAYWHLKKLSQSYSVDVALITRSLSSGTISGINVDTLHIFHVGALCRLLMAFFSLFLLIPPRFATRLSFPALIKMRSLARGEYDLVFFEFSQVFPYVCLFHRVANKVLSLHDLQAQVVSRKSLLERLTFYRMTLGFERRLLEKADSIHYQAPSDSEMLTRMYGMQRAKLHFTPPALSGFVNNFKRDQLSIRPYSILFWGAMGRVENSRAITRFIDKSFCSILQRFPSAVLYVVGSNPPMSLSQKASQSIVVTGFVDDPTEYFKIASVGIAPLEEGAGIKVKVLEMLECGLDVVTTPIGSEGIDHSSRLHIVNVGEFAEAIGALWEKHDYLQ